MEGLGWMLMEHSGTAKDKKPEKEQEKRQKKSKVGSEGHLIFIVPLCKLREGVLSSEQTEPGPGHVAGFHPLLIPGPAAIVL